MESQHERERLFSARDMNESIRPRRESVHPFTEESEKLFLYRYFFLFPILLWYNMSICNTEAKILFMLSRDSKINFSVRPLSLHLHTTQSDCEMS